MNCWREIGAYVEQIMRQAAVLYVSGQYAMVTKDIAIFRRPMYGGSFAIHARPVKKFIGHILLDGTFKPYAVEWNEAADSSLFVIEEAAEFDKSNQ